MLNRQTNLLWLILFLSLVVACSPAAGDSAGANDSAPTVVNPDESGPEAAGTSGEPPPATLTIDGQEQEGGIGSYCWTTTSSQESATHVCADMVGVPTDPEPLPAGAPVLAQFHLPVEGRPDRASLDIFPVTEADALPGEQRGWRWWSFKSGEHHTLEVTQDPHKELALEPGLYVFLLFAGWPNLGDASYGFLVEVSGPAPLGAVREATAADGHAIYAPALPVPAVDTMAALMEGRLVEVDGCLRITGLGYPDGFLMIWPYGTQIRVEGERIELVNEAGLVIGRVGEPFRAGGGAIENSLGMQDYDQHIEGMPIPGCPGPYWVAGDLETLAEQAIADLWVHPFSSGGRILGTFFEQSRADSGNDELAGQLRVSDDGCLRVGDHLMFWPPGFFLLEDPLRIANMERTVSVEIGEPVRVTGGERSPADYRFFENKVRCAGPYWGANAVLPAE